MMASAKYFLILMMVSFQSLAHDRHEKGSGIFPPNDLKIYPYQKSNFRIDRQVFDQLIVEFQKLFDSQVSGRSAVLDVQGNWSSASVNAYAQQFVNQKGQEVFRITLLGGIARHSDMSADGLRAILCHELGHHIAGAPKFRSVWAGTQWASSEGQSDYYASAKCLRDMFAGDDNKKIIQSMNIPVKVSAYCDLQFTVDTEQSAICQRSSMAAQDVMMVLYDVSRRTSGSFREPPPDFETPDSSKVSRTNLSYPSIQCRLDTFFAGALCKVDHHIAFSDTDTKVGACYGDPAQEMGARPLCWYRPN